MAPETEVNVLSAFRSDVQTIRYSELASSSIIIFDHLLTLDQEYDLIWSSPWSIGKCLFLFNRYYTLITMIFNNYALFSPNISDYFCLHWYRWQGWTGVISFVVAELILQLRLYALYFLDKRILVFMATTSLIAAAASAAVMGSVLSKIKATAHMFPDHPFCVATGISNHFYAFWIPMLVSESVLCGLALARFAQTHRRGSTLFQTGKRLVESLIRDSVFYFVVMFATYLANAIVFIVGNATEVEIPVGFSVALSCVLGNRLCLNVRGMIRREQSVPSSEYEDEYEDQSWLPEEMQETPVYSIEAGSHLSDVELRELRAIRPDQAATV
ncbi:uncharacterized protein LAESUDRAFT_729797, partial [Laetiporus sulphureus 93-53]